MRLKDEFQNHRTGHTFAGHVEHSDGPMSRLTVISRPSSAHSLPFTREGDILIHETGQEFFACAHDLNGLAARGLKSYVAGIVPITHQVSVSRDDEPLAELIPAHAGPLSRPVEQQLPDRVRFIAYRLLLVRCTDAPAVGRGDTVQIDGEEHRIEHVDSLTWDQFFILRVKNFT